MEHASVSGVTLEGNGGVKEGKASFKTSFVCVCVCLGKAAWRSCMDSTKGAASLKTQPS